MQKSIKVQTVGEKSENKAVGRTKGGINTKIHAIVDGLGNPVAFLLSPGNDGDSTHAKEILAYIKKHGAAVVIPPKSNTKEPWEIATRYDKLDKSFLSFVYMAACMIWLL